MAVFDGTADSDMFAGGAGNDTINGLAGNDTLSGEAGADSINGGQGDDRLYSGSVSPLYQQPYYGGGVAPLLDTGTENDTLSGGEGDDEIFAGYGDVVDGGASSSWGDYLLLSLQGATAGVHADFSLLSSGPVTIGGAQISGIEGFKWLEGSQFDDYLKPFMGYYGGYAPVYGMGGNDTIVGVYQSGTLYGGEGDDLVDARNGSGAAAYGDAGNDTLLGGYGGQQMNGGAGEDSIVGGSGSEIIVGGDDADIINGAGGGDNISGDAGDDTIFGANDYDVISGGDGADIIFGDFVPLADTIYGGNDSISGDAGNDWLQGDWGDDTIDGGSGNDTVVYAGEYAEYTIGYDSLTKLAVISDGVGNRDGTDRVTTVESFQFADQTLTLTQLASHFGTPFNDTFTGTSGADAYNGMGGNDSIVGGEGNDTLAGGPGNDTLNGGNGVDTLTYAGSASGITVNIGSFSGQATVGAGTDTVSNFENLTGGDGADRLNGNVGANRIEGGKGNDTLNGEGGADTLVGGLGDDLYTVTSALATIVEADGQGTDAVNATASVDVSGVSVENITLLGSAAINAVGNNADNALTGNSGANVLYGMGGHDLLRGGASGDSLDAGEGNDTLEGEAGADTLDGGAGFDILAGGDGADDLYGGDGDDRIYSYLAPDVTSYPYNDPPNDTFAQVDNLFGGAGSDLVFAGYGDNVDGGPGTDTLFVSFAGASSGVHADFSDLYPSGTVTAGGATITGIEAVTFIEGSNFDDDLTASSGSGSYPFDSLFGRGGNDHLVAGYYTYTVMGGDGNDVIDVRGGQYITNVHGDAGDDTIVASNNSGWNTYHGDAGRDTVDYSGELANHPVQFDENSGWHVENGSYTTTVVDVERLQFDDVCVAIDLDGNAGQVARLLGAVFGAPWLEVAVAAGIGLDFLDSGGSILALTQQALDYWLGPNASNTLYVNTVYANLAGVAPSADVLAYYVGLLDDGVVSQAEMTQYAMVDAANEQHIVLAGIPEHGLAYVPY